jgi:uridine kinase
MFNSSLAYELAVFRTYAWPYLLEVPKDSPSYTMARDMLRFLTMVVPLNSEWVPKNSVLREFLGGSIYQY